MDTHKGLATQYLTPTEKRLLDRLMDGNRHRLKDLMSLLWDELTDVQTLRKHVANLRGKLTEQHAIVCEMGSCKKTYYRLVKLFSPNSTYP